MVWGSYCIFDENPRRMPHNTSVCSRMSWGIGVLGKCRSSLTVWDFFVMYFCSRRCFLSHRRKKTHACLIYCRCLPQLLRLPHRQPPGLLIHRLSWTNQTKLRRVVTPCSASGAEPQVTTGESGDRAVEAEPSPDLIFRHLHTGERFFVH